MMTQRTGVQLGLLTTSIEELIPHDHFLRQLDSAVNFEFIYEELAPYYSKNNGKPSIDPVVIVKQLLIGFLYGINSERRLEEECKYNIAYRWFLGLGFDETIPDHSTVSQLRRRKFNESDLFKRVFSRVLKICVESGLVSGKLLLTDSTHVKANASKTSKYTSIVEHETQEYFKRLEAYESEERKRLSMPEIERKLPENIQTEQTKSSTDPDTGWLRRPNKPDGFHYLSHQTLDAENGIIIDVAVTAGNTSDNMPYLEQISRSIDTLAEMDIKIEAVSADSSYDTALIHKELDNRGIAVYMPKKETADNSKAMFKKNDFTYNSDTDTFTCPAGETLFLRCLQRYETGVFREYRATAKTCNYCPHREKCLAPSQKSRKVQVNIFQDIIDKHHKSDGGSEYTEALSKRQIWCEGTFSAQKSQHNLKQLFRKGLRAAADHCFISACAINLKRLVKYHVQTT